MRQNFNLFKDKELSDKLFFILKGKNRMRIYISLLDDIKSAMEIGKDLDVSLSSICRSLKEMQKQKIIKCLNLYDYRGKYYQLESDVLKLKEIIIRKSKAKSEQTR